MPEPPPPVIQTFDQIRAKVAAAAAAAAASSQPTKDNSQTKPQKQKREKKPKEPTTNQDTQSTNQQPSVKEKTKRPSSSKKQKQSQPPAQQVAKEPTEPKAKKQTVKKPKAKPLPEPKTKVVVRRLPPNLPEKIFWDSVKEWVEENTVDWKVYVPGKPPKSRGKVGSFGRAYLHFTALEHVMVFHRAYDGHLFVDSKGNENRAVVEFAPYQIVPKVLRKPDARQGTIQEDRDYLAFLESLKDTGNDETNDAEMSLEQPVMKDGIISTPLLDDLREKKAAELAARQRNQPVNKVRTMLSNSAQSRSRGNVSGSHRDNGMQNTSPKTSTKSSPQSGTLSKSSSSSQIAKSNVALPSTNAFETESSRKRGSRGGNKKGIEKKKEGENISAKPSSHASNVPGGNPVFAKPSSPASTASGGNNAYAKPSSPASTGSGGNKERRINGEKETPKQAPKPKKVAAERPAPVILRRDQRPTEGNTPAPAEPAKQTSGTTGKQPTRGPVREQVQPTDRQTRSNSEKQSKGQARPLPEQHKNKIRNLLQRPSSSRNKEEKPGVSNRASNNHLGKE